ncbi:MAG: hypothetical protein RL302_861 [Pseudomonadota bacterium]|jgi:uncharacterized protein (DUF4415 family)
MKNQSNPEIIDDENPAWTAAETRKAMKFSELSTTLQTKLRGRPKALATKEPVKIRLDADILAALRASGDGWQTRINDTLRASLQLAGKLNKSST